MTRSMIALLMIVALNAVADADYTYSDYDWHAYNDHWYALTIDIGTWWDAEAEAVAIGGHLVTINDQPEDEWLVSSVGFGPELDAADPKHLWIGFYQDHADPAYSEPAGGWKWISGEAVTYTGWGGLEPNNLHGEDFGIIRQSPDIFWTDWGPTSVDYTPIRGIIETAVVPAPGAFVLASIGVTLAGWLCKRRNT